MGQRHKKKARKNSNKNLLEITKKRYLGEYYLECLKNYGKGYAIINHVVPRGSKEAIKLGTYTLLTNPSVPASDRKMVEAVDQNEFLIFVNLVGIYTPSALQFVRWTDPDIEQIASQEILVPEGDLFK